MASKLDTPKKARVQGAIQLARFIQESHGISISDNDMATIFNTSHTTVNRLRHQDPLTAPGRTLHNDPAIEDRRGRPYLLGGECQALMDLYAVHGIEARVMPWAAQGHEALDIEVSGRTVRRAMAKRGVHKYKAVEKRFMKAPQCTERMAYARRMLEEFDPQDWRRVRFSDETHFS